MRKTIINVSHQITDAALGVAEGTFSHTVDLLLWYTVFMAELSVPFQSYGKPFRASVSADRFLSQVNYDVIKHAIISAKHRGWITRRSRHAIPEITNEGRKRLSSSVPHYDAHRLWDGRMHLVTYDIPEKRTDDRHMLRQYLLRIGCGRLQDSVWITPYNPIDTVRTFIEERSLAGTVVVSDMGSDGAIGEEDIRSLIVRIYRLEELNDRYVSWIADARKHTVDHWLAAQFLSILKDDQQLPFGLLPSWWKGDQAYKMIESFLTKVYFAVPTGT